MAWHYAVYVEAVARAGKIAYPLPMLTNAALNRPGKKPGEYPTGGPLPHLFDAWKAGAPSLDLLAPDIYYPDFVTWCDRYARPGNPLFIPEARNEARCPDPRAVRDRPGRARFLAVRHRDRRPKPWRPR